MVTPNRLVLGEGLYILLSVLVCLKGFAEAGFAAFDAAQHLLAAATLATGGAVLDVLAGLRLGGFLLDGELCLVGEDFRVRLVL